MLCVEPYVKRFANEFLYSVCNKNGTAISRLVYNIMSIMCFRSRIRACRRYRVCGWVPTSQSCWICSVTERFHASNEAFLQTLLERRRIVIFQIVVCASFSKHQSSLWLTSATKDLLSRNIKFFFLCVVTLYTVFFMPLQLYYFKLTSLLQFTKVIPEVQIVEYNITTIKIRNL